ncbi:hypothetical protein E3A20_10450, partial [Planctomyces bekefii]
NSSSVNHAKHAGMRERATMQEVRDQRTGAVRIAA